MKIIIIEKNKKYFINLLLLADEQENMIDKYLERGIMFALYDDDLKGVCVVTRESNKICEIKNIAIYEKFQGKGYGKKFIKYIFEYFEKQCDKFIVGTGDSLLTIPFYKSCGFEESYRIKKFFIENYDKPIYECGKQLVDMVYLEKKTETLTKK